jgi:hypothetical protein
VWGRQDILSGCAQRKEIQVRPIASDVNRFSNKSSVRIFFVSGLAGRGVLGRQVAELYRQPLIEAQSKGPFLVAKRPKNLRRVHWLRRLSRQSGEV